MAKRKYFRKNKKKELNLKKIIKIIIILLALIMAFKIGKAQNNINILTEQETTPEAQNLQADEEIEYITRTVTAYSELDSCHYPTQDGCLTASGKIAEVGMVASNIYPFGTRLLINGEEYVVEDRISTKYNDRIDIFMGYGQRAYNWAKDFGIKDLEIKVLTK